MGYERKKRARRRRGGIPADAGPRDSPDTVGSIQSLCRGAGVSYLHAQMGNPTTPASGDANGFGSSPIAKGGRPTGETPSLWRGGLQRSGTRSKKPETV